MTNPENNDCTLAPERSVEIPFNFGRGGGTMSLFHMFVGRVLCPRVACSEGFAMMHVELQDNSLERACADVPWITNVAVDVVQIAEGYEGKITITGMMHR